MLKLRYSAEPPRRTHRIHVVDDAGAALLPAWYADLRLIQVSPVAKGACAFLVAPAGSQVREGAILMTRQEDVLWNAAPDPGDAFVDMRVAGAILQAHTRQGKRLDFDLWTGQPAVQEQKAA